MSEYLYDESEEYDSREIQYKISNSIIVVFNLVGMPVVIHSVYEALRMGLLYQAIFYVLFSIPVALSGILRHRLNYPVKVGLMLLTVYLLGVTDLATYGFQGATLPLFITFMVLATIFLGIKSGMISLGIILITMATGSALYLNKIIFLKLNTGRLVESIFYWGIIISILFVLSFGMIYSIGVIQKHLKKLLGFSRKQQIILQQRTIELEQSNSLLEQELQRRKEILDQLQIAKTKAEESDHLKTAFLNQISHHIRTPLNGVIGFSEMLGDPDLMPEEREEYLELVNDSGDQLTAVIEKMISYAVLVRGEQQIKEERFILGDLMQQIVVQYQGEIAEKGLSFQVNSAENIECFTDQSYLEQIIKHLIENSIKFTETGGISVDYRRSQTTVEIIVKDSGIGIPEEIQQTLFTPFQTGTFHDQERYGGTGLGLAIVGESLKVLKGGIELQSIEGRGTTITITLPLQQG